MADSEGETARGQADRDTAGPRKSSQRQTGAEGNGRDAGGSQDAVPRPLQGRPVGPLDQGKRGWKTEARRAIPGFAEGRRGPPTGVAQAREQPCRRASAHVAQPRRRCARHPSLSSSPGQTPSRPGILPWPDQPALRDGLFPVSLPRAPVFRRCVLVSEVGRLGQLVVALSLPADLGPAAPLVSAGGLRPVSALDRVGDPGLGVAAGGKLRHVGGRTAGGTRSAI